MSSEAEEKDADAIDQELEKIVSFFDSTPEGEEWEVSKKRLRMAIQKKRIKLNEDTATISLRLVTPIVDDDANIDTLVFHEPLAQDLKQFDKYKDNEKMSKMIHLAAKMSGKKIEVIDKMGARDLQTMAAVASLFF